MIQNYSDISSHGGHLFNSEIKKPNDSELYRLIQNATELKNTTEKKFNHVVHVPENEGAASKTGLLKYFILGVTAMAGVGALAAGGYYYISGRASSDGRLENMLPGRLSVPEINNSTSWLSDGNSSKISSATMMDIISSQPGIQTTSTPSPYSYYEGIYGSAAERNNHPSSLPVTTTHKAITTVKPESHYDTAKAIEDEYKENHKVYNYNIIYKEKLNSYYLSKSEPVNEPLNELRVFCFFELKNIIEQAYQDGSPATKKLLLGELVNKIKVIQKDRSVVHKANAGINVLSEEERYFESLLKQKLVTLYSAIEAVMHGQHYDAFLDKALSDHTEYSYQELKQRGKKLMSSLSEN